MTETSLAPETDDDDAQVGRILSRREVLRLMGAVGVGGLIIACGPNDSRSPIPSTAAAGASGSPTALATTAAPVATPAGAASTGGPASATPVQASATPIQGNATPVPACVVVPELTEGPFFLDDELVRRDIRSDPSGGPASEGVPLEIVFAVSRIDGAACTALPKAIVDIWQCDALGIYSGVSGAGSTPATASGRFLRGQQVTDANGLAQFTTIVPGWYQGRAVHVHFKVRADEAASGTFEFTSQLFFEDTLVDEVHARPPYAAKGQRTIRNADDGIFRDGGDVLPLDLIGDAGSGYSASFDIGLRPA